MSHFIQEDEQLLIISDTGTVEWKGQPSGWPIAKVIQFNESQTAILLLRYFKWEKTRGINLICINSKAEIIWQAAEKNKL